MKPLLSIWLLFLLLVPALPAAADQVVSSRPDKGLYGIATQKQFKTDDLLCIMVEEVKVACGDVFRVAGKGIMLYVTSGTRQIKPGTQVELQYEVANPQSRAITAGMNYLFPSLHFQQHFTGRMAYGFMGEGVIYNRSEGKIKGIIAMMTLSYYGQSLFKGPWLMAGAGIHFFNLQDPSEVGENGRDSITSFVGQLNMGWRFRFSRVTFGLAVGAQYWMDPNLKPLTLKEIPGLVPSAMIDIGLVF